MNFKFYSDLLISLGILLIVSGHLPVICLPHILFIIVKKVELPWIDHNRHCDMCKIQNDVAIVEKLNSVPRIP